MGIESDQLVLDYLSRVGDLAQQRLLPSSDRMRLVSELRSEIDRRRAKAPVDSPASVRRILSRLGTPEEVVTAAGTGGAGGSGGASGASGTGPAGDIAEPRTALPSQRDSDRDFDRGRSGGRTGENRPRGLRRVVPRPRSAEPEPVRPPSDAPSPPHLAGTHELGDSATQPDWWRVDHSVFGPGESVPGFVGGVEIPELLKPPPRDLEAKAPASAQGSQDGAKDAKDEGGAGRAEGGGPAVETAPARGARRLLPRPGQWSNPLLLLAAALLVAGAILGSWLALGLGWLIAYGSRRLTPAESKWAVVMLPSLAATAGIIWLWGRREGRWGDPIAEGHMTDALTETWPWVVRGAATASALYLAWRSQRPR
ncbi:HAAS signaling domain-containing protein [Streptomyces sp. NPDC059786]|uniref:HAAS signaling domain-containing protein n=1 Tax=Streptomyces sp. NPDC059786 TaxID=3346946 RepID=UPI003654043E